MRKWRVRWGFCRGSDRENLAVGMAEIIDNWELIIEDGRRESSEFLSRSDGASLAVGIAHGVGAKKEYRVALATARYGFGRVVRKIRVVATRREM